jgi:hypothetical protein
MSSKISIGLTSVESIRGNLVPSLVNIRLGLKSFLEINAAVNLPLMKECFLS